MRVEGYTEIPEKYTFQHDLKEYKSRIKKILDHYKNFGYDTELRKSFDKSGWETSFLDQDTVRNTLTEQHIKRFLKHKIIKWLHAYGVETRQFQEIADPLELLDVVEQVADGGQYPWMFIETDGLRRPLSAADRESEKLI